MEFLVLVKATKESEAGEMPTREMLAPMGAFNDTLERDGIFLRGDGLKPTSQATRISFAGGKPTIIDGPFAETKELVAGFWLLQGRSKEEIVERMSHAPFTRGEQIEIRPIYDLEGCKGIL